MQCETTQVIPRLKHKTKYQPRPTAKALRHYKATAKAPPLENALAPFVEPLKPSQKVKTRKAKLTAKVSPLEESLSPLMEAVMLLNDLEQTRESSCEVFKIGDRVTLLTNNQWHGKQGSVKFLATNAIRVTLDDGDELFCLPSNLSRQAPEIPFTPRTKRPYRKYNQ